MAQGRLGPPLSGLRVGPSREGLKSAKFAGPVRGQIHVTCAAPAYVSPQLPKIAAFMVEIVDRGPSKVSVRRLVVMHDSAYEIGSKVLSTYANKTGCTVLEIGALDVNGSLRDACPSHATYLGVDYETGKGVDLLVRPGQPIPLQSESVDLIISSSQMEHDPEFWKTLDELFRIVKTGGVIYINSPSNGNYHPYPSDVWRFYSDAGKAFATLGRKNNYPMTLLESFIAKRINDQWNDFVCVLFKGEWPKNEQVKYLSDIFDSYNVWRFEAKEMVRMQTVTEDQHIIENLRKEVVRLQAKLARTPERGLGSRIWRNISKANMTWKRRTPVLAK